jgi:hypothetical protein
MLHFWIDFSAFDREYCAGRAKLGVIGRFGLDFKEFCAPRSNQLN